MFLKQCSGPKNWTDKLTPLEAKHVYGPHMDHFSFKTTLVALAGSSFLYLQHDEEKPIFKQQCNEEEKETEVQCLPLTMTLIILKSISPLAMTRASQVYIPSSVFLMPRISRWPLSMFLNRTTTEEAESNKVVLFGLYYNTNNQKDVPYVQQGNAGFTYKQHTNIYKSSLSV